MKRILGLFVLLVLVIPSSALAASEEDDELASYKSAIVLSHAIPAGLGWAAAGIAQGVDRQGTAIPAIAIASGGGLVPPIVHFSYGNFWTGMGSYFMNTTLTYGGAALGASGAFEFLFGSNQARQGLSVLTGVSLAHAVGCFFDLALAEEATSSSKKAKAKADADTMAWSPRLSLTPEGGMMLGAYGTF